MRGMVMEVQGNTLVVLTPQGHYIRVRNHGGAVIGDSVPCDNPIAPRIVWVPRKAMALAASFMLICTISLSAYGYSQPFGIVSIDINPSMTLTYNWFEQVISVEALNADAKKLLPNLNTLRNKPVLEAVETVVSAASQAGYLKPELKNVLFISVSDKNSIKRSTAIIKTLIKEIPEISGETETVLLTGSTKTYESTKKNHETPTKDLIEASLKNQPENDPLTHSSKPLREIMNDQKIKQDRLKNPNNPNVPNDPKVPNDSINPVIQDNGNAAGSDKTSNKPETKTKRNPTEKNNVDKNSKSGPESFKPGPPWADNKSNGSDKDISQRNRYNNWTPSKH